MAKYIGKTITVENKNYRLTEEIGGGGNGTVFAAASDGDPHEYAVKFLLQGHSDPDKVARFLAEIEFCKTANHPNVLKVVGNGLYNDRYFYIMPRYRGTLRDIIEKENDIWQLLQICIQLCEGVAYIHGKQIIHRDLKPENVLFGDNDELVIADFGIAHFIDSSMTKEHDWLGNKRYAAPEQLYQEKITDLTAACDIFALGRIINEVFTKHNPDGTSYQQIADIYPVLSPVDYIVNRCLSQNPAERPSIEELVTELKLFKSALEAAIFDIQDGLLFDEEADISEETIDKLTLRASIDILGADYVFKHATDEQLARINPNYHRDVSYNTDNVLKNLYFLHRLYYICWGYFKSEAAIYSKSEQYLPLNMNKEIDRRLYNDLSDHLEQHPVPRKYGDLAGCILKLFVSCCDYHCHEILERIPELLKDVDDLVNSPIYYLVILLRNTFDADTIKEITLEDHLSINWDNTEYEIQEEPELYVTTDNNEHSIIEKLKNDWNVIVSKANPQYYSIRFRDKTTYETFRSYALQLAEPYYVFMGDVLKVLHIYRESDGIIELYPVDSFDITSTLAKILGLRKDY